MPQKMYELVLASLSIMPLESIVSLDAEIRFLALALNDPQKGETFAMSRVRPDKTKTYPVPMWVGDSTILSL